ncbi:hypothetical protein [Sphaerotilus mobilis]|uniref:Uncharacterized protein n=1 Tax=Sphaerotilus mobilis TaxID=47994 RepID=A0A4Q7LTW8_9BURK|nr:hypothetical protein [Sphaerotilus mobilis]RZS58545.1 hypothetical protein EV685_0840 [Sphaerotilus mobilis]
MIDVPTLRLLVDLALAISLGELLWSAWRTPPGRARLAVLAHLGAGLGLMLALRFSLAREPGDATTAAVLVCLTLAGLSHLIDVRLRLSAGTAACPAGANPVALKGRSP